ncbi:MAG: hypothetical protein GEU73_11125 [Chloroflexi bacterium]|nr:hypothetical protein [Chloroflexota bacterium]
MTIAEKQAETAANWADSWARLTDDWLLIAGWATDNWVQLAICITFVLAFLVLRRWDRRRQQQDAAVRDLLGRSHR